MNLQMKVLHENIANNWLAITDKEENKILVEYSAMGRIKAVGYFGAYIILFVNLGKHETNAILFLKHSWS